jgi:hypothetical protein
MIGVHSLIKCWESISIKAQKTIILPPRCKILTMPHGVTCQQTVPFTGTIDRTAVEKNKIE